MEAEERREAIKILLSKSSQPVVARTLANTFHVSRQVIVGDIALLRASGEDILSTPKGYLLGEATSEGVMVQLVFNHTPEETKEELFTIVDNGGEVIDVLVEHPIYGMIKGNLNISNRMEAEEFVKQVSAHDIPLLSNLTEGIHSHTIRAKTPELLKRIEDELRRKNFLYN
ncbi:transcription repressor NadR [Alkalibacterium sp. MB6]|uniref:transcription repressor NadR n=1 Tax=Alkalibacterium sp. MB6 TaxID=2081965 RepID=UPI0013797B44|nr:transcription repressor NadR [Alkalibacterium sp. MB6]